MHTHAKMKKEWFLPLSKQQNVKATAATSTDWQTKSQNRNMKQLYTSLL